MRFEVQYPKGAPHEVELQGTVAILGRDPSCDLVLNDAKCSRRHAVLEAGPQGIAIRDTGSANGVYVNGKKVERAQLAEGDVVRVGEVRLTVLAEDVPGTLVMGPEDMDQLHGGTRPEAGPAPPPPRPRPQPAYAAKTDGPGPPPAPPAPRPPEPPPLPPAPRAMAVPVSELPTGSIAPRPTMSPRPPAREASQPPRPPAAVRDVPPRSAPALDRPLTVSVLASLWALSALVYGAGGLGLAFNRGLGGAAFAVSVVSGLLLAIFSAAMSAGLFGRRGWARILQIATAAVGVLSCAFTLSSITILVYMLRPAASIHFSGRPSRTLSSEEAETAADTSAETAFTAAILGTVLLGGGLLSVVAFLAGRVGRTF